MTNNEIYLKAIEFYGEEAQKLKAIEELAELIVAISQDDSLYNTAEEIGDVEHVLEYIIIIFGTHHIELEHTEYTKDDTIKVLAELIKEICKGYDVPKISKLVVEAKAALEQLKIRKNCTMLVNSIKYFKLERLLKRMEMSAADDD